MAAEGPTLRLIWFITVLAWLVAGIAPLHAAGMGMGDAIHDAACCPDQDDDVAIPHEGNGSDMSQTVCDHASICVSLMLPQHPFGPASEFRPATLQWQDRARTADSVTQTADPPPPRL